MKLNNTDQQTLMNLIEPHLGTLREKFYAKIVAKYGESYSEEVAELKAEHVDIVDVMDEVMCYVIGNIDDVFDEIDGDDMIGQFMFEE